MSRFFMIAQVPNTTLVTVAHILKAERWGAAGEVDLSLACKREPSGASACSFDPDQMRIVDQSYLPPAAAAIARDGRPVCVPFDDFPAAQRGEDLVLDGGSAAELRELLK
ncbi:TPA: hypothetical protein ACJJYF_001393 [Enterobacter cloacae]|uniref:Uncharacterized protein n=1 Tax=Enterobacter kobei TaxID=208224 RepID=A0A2J0PMJ9_9ENTR|nr:MULTISPECIES: hypothetical protein [Enterobacter cloacae complex]MCE1547219.1 hypothetical protein [Enterobacter hormaechei]KPU03845.1 hypothetical protein AN697_16160 [Enterobacter cloacae subsp. cloacae]PJD65363.1 hypothetical protein B9Q29_20530 [Enterobacter kobei]PJD74633.1 hypothetical protein B9Q37_12120 [Enterobacter kobei]HBM2451792.1 hypothetical protein [Enterobacter hormaechei]